jgi:hypothetical protein
MPVTSEQLALMEKGNEERKQLLAEAKRTDPEMAIILRAEIEIMDRSIAAARRAIEHGQQAE